MTYDKAHKMLWGTVIRILKSYRKQVKDGSTTLLNRLSVKDKAFETNPKLPIPEEGYVESDCYACHYASVEKRKLKGCSCFLNWGNKDNHCLNPSSPYVSLGHVLSDLGAKADPEKLKQAIKLAEQIRDLPLKKWYKPTRIVEEKVKPAVL